MSSKNNTRHAARKAFVLSSLSVALLSAGYGSVALAAPTGGTVVRGSATFDTSTALQTIINQTSDKAVINWNDFSISANELVKFAQLSSTSVVLNRVTTAAQSNILGTLQANGRVFLVNPNGIVFGAGAHIDVAGLLATTLDVDNDAFMAGGNLTFAAADNLAKIVNNGEIRVGDNGFVYLVAPSVENNGSIGLQDDLVMANVAQITLAAGNQFAVNLQGGNLIDFSVSADALTAAGTDANLVGVKNTGTLTAQNVLLSANQANALMSSVVNNTGVIEATTLDISGANIVQNGRVTATGTATLTATQSITTPASATSTPNLTKAHTLNLAVTADGASIGAEDAPLRVDADILNASAVNGHVLVTDVADGVALGTITTGTNDDTNQRRAIIASEGGSITSADPGATNITAWSTTLTSAGSIGTDGQALNTDVNILTATAGNGGVNVRNAGGLMLGAIQTSEVLNVGGQNVALTVLSDANGNIRFANGAAGSANVSIEAGGDLIVGGAITAGNALNLTSDGGNIYAAPSSGGTGGGPLMGRTINLTAGGAIGADGAALKLQTETLNAAAGNGGIYVGENNGLTVGTLVAGGANNNVSVSVGQGALKLGSIDAAGGQVSLTVTSGATTDNNGSALNVRGAGLAINAGGAVGTAADKIETDVDTIDATVTAAAAGLYLSNDKKLDALSAVTGNGDVSIDFNVGALAFNHGNHQLTLTGANPMDLVFSNQGDIVVASDLNVGGAHDISLTSTVGAITASGGSTLTAQTIALAADDDIGAAGAALNTKTTQLDATSTTGAINVNDASTGALTVTATAEGSNGAVSVAHAGDMTVNEVSTTGKATLHATGALVSGATDGAAVVAGSLDLSGASVGSAATPFATQVSARLDSSNNPVAGTGLVSITSGGDVDYANIGTLTQVDVTAQGDIGFSNQGTAAVGKLQAGATKAIDFSNSGAVTDANGNDLNFVAKDLTVTAGVFGTQADSLETQVRTLTVDTSSGGIFVSNSGGQALSLVKADTGGAGAVGIASDGDIALGVVDAGGADASIASGGAIEKLAGGSGDANVTARSLTLSADQGIGSNGTLALNVSQLSASGGSGGVQAANTGAIAVDASTLENRGSGGVSITATDITILDNHGGTIAMDPNGNLVLVATSGSIVFLNQADTIYVRGSGSITMTALGQSDLDGYNGAIIVGNLKTDGGSIRLEAQSNITIGMLDATSNGDVSIIAHNGVLLDGNGSLENIIGNDVEISVHTPTLRDAQLTEETAIAEYSAKQAELNAKIAQLEEAIQQLESYQRLVADAAARQAQAARDEKSTAREVDNLSALVDAAQSVLDGLNTALSAATVVRNAAAVVAGAAQAVPFSGDAGADAAFAVVDLALSAAQTAVDVFETYTFNPLDGQLDDLNNELDQAKAALTAANNNLHDLTAQRDAWQISKNTDDQSVFKATVAFNAAGQLRRQAVAAYDLNKDIDSSADKPLGISANRLDIAGSGADGALNTSLYLETAGNLGLGDIKVASGETIKAQADQNISVVGTVNSDTSIDLNAGGAILGAGGTLVTPELTAVAGNGIGMNQAVNTKVSTLAADGGAGGVNISNRTGQLITVSELGAVRGVSGAGDITLDTDADLKLDQSVDDTAGTHTVTLESGGAIIDGNGADLNAQGGELAITAVNAVDMDTRFAGLTAALTGTGDLDIRNAGDLVAHQVTVADGDLGIHNTGDLVANLATVADGNLDIDSAGNLVVGTLSADASTGAITLTAGGRIDGDGDAATGISGDHLTLTAGGSIGITGGRLTTQVNALDGLAGGAIQIAEADDLAVGTLSTTQGDVFLTTLAGSMALGSIGTATGGTSDNTITLVASGGIDNGLADDASNLTAANLSLSAGSGIGAGKALNIEAARLEASGGTGGIALADLSGDLLVDSVATSGGAPALNGLEASGGNISVTVKQGSLNVGKHVDSTGNGNIALDASGAILLGGSVTGKADVAATAGGAVTQNADIATDTGNVTIDSTAGDVTMADGTSTTVTGAGDISYTAHGGDMTLETITGTNATFNASGALTLNGVVTALDSVSATAGGNINQNADILTANGPVTATATAGNITMADGTSTIVSGDGDVSYGAKGNIRVNTIDTQDGNVRLAAETGSIEGNASAAYHVAGKDLNAAAATGIGSLAQPLKTRIDTLTAQVTQGGTLNVDEADALQLTQAGNADGLLQVNAGGDITAFDVRSTTGTVALTSAGSVNTGTGGLIQAADLQVQAQDGVAIHTRADRASVAVLGQGDVAIDETGSIALDQIRTADGDITVGAAGGIAVNSVSAGAGSGNVSLTSGDAITSAAAGTDPQIVADALGLAAATGIGNGPLGALRLDVNRLRAGSTAGDVNLDQAKAIAVDSLAAGQGNANLLVRLGDATLGAVAVSGQATLTAAAGALRDDGDAATRVAADSATLAAAGDIAVQTQVDRLSATAGGAVDIDEADGLAGLSVQSPAGDVSVRSASGDIVVDTINADGHAVSLQAAGGAIRDAGAGVASVTAERLVLDAARGVGSADNGMDVMIHSLSAQGGTGGIYVNNLYGGELALAGAGNGDALGAAGDIVLTTAGDLGIGSGVSGTGDGRIVLQSGGDIAQDGNVTAAGKGSVSLISDGSIAMGPQAKTTGQGDIVYRAADSVSIGQIETSTGSNGGRVTLTAATIVDNLPNGANIKAGVIDMDSRASSPELVRDLVGDQTNAASVNLDSRPYGGTYTQSQQFINELSNATSSPYYGNFMPSALVYSVWAQSGSALVTDVRGGGSLGASSTDEQTSR
ncbi:ESPR-type extended signal peptide-containing protein [Pigmentiphaga soli]|uniref:ESPR-type extended signal peptide-containing protein n=1 Tax=Pigmentiphaga soli TaxID=1007095 RepID=A0ABP8GK20_9BURK